MPWTAIAIGGSVLGGMFGSRRAAREQRRMRRELRRQREFAQERWQHFRDTYGDLENILVNEAESGVVADIAGVSSRAAADTAMAFDRQRDQQQRQAMSFGLDPTSGRYQGMDRSMGINEALAESHNVGSAREDERRWADAETRNLRMGMWGQGAQIGEGAAQDYMAAGGRLADMHGQSAAQWSNMANNMFAQAGFLGAYNMGGGAPQQPQQQQQPNLQGMQHFQAPQQPGPTTPAARNMHHPTLGMPAQSPQSFGTQGGLNLYPTYLTGN